MKRAVIITILLMFAASSSQAVMKLDFEQAWELAKEHNRNLKLLKMDKKFADLQVKEAYSAAMPSISAMGNYYYNFIIPELRTEFTMNGQKTEFVMALEKEHNYYGAIQLDQPIWSVYLAEIMLGLSID